MNLLQKLKIAVGILLGNPSTNAKEWADAEVKKLRNHELHIGKEKEDKVIPDWVTEKQKMSNLGVESWAPELYTRLSLIRPSEYPERRCEVQPISKHVVLTPFNIFNQDFQRQYKNSLVEPLTPEEFYHESRSKLHPMQVQFIKAFDDHLMPLVVSWQSTLAQEQLGCGLSEPNTVIDLPTSKIVEIINSFNCVVYDEFEKMRLEKFND